MLRDKILTKLLGPLALACAVAPAVAGNVMFLKDSAISRMSEADVELMDATARSALEDTADGESQRWENTETGATGVVTPVATFEQDGTLCRRLELLNEAKGITGRSAFVFCRQPDGSWKIPAQAPAKAAGGEAAPK
jgi:surface antigen